MNNFYLIYGNDSSIINNELNKNTFSLPIKLILWYLALLDTLPINGVLKGISISSEPDYVIVIRILSDGSWEEVYNGPGKPVWDNAGKTQKNGQRPISLSKLRSLMNSMETTDTIARILWG